jgi:hypothetical protein
MEWIITLYRICSPIYLIGGFSAGIVILSGLAFWQIQTHREPVNDFDRGNILLVGLLFLAILGIVAFFAYAFLRLWIC